MDATAPSAYRCRAWSLCAPQAKNALERARREARSLDSDSVGTEHTLLAITSIQARKRIVATRPARHSEGIKVGHEYERKGALCYLAAWDARRAKIFDRCAPKDGIVPFDALVAQFMSQHPYKSAQRVFLIVDNGSAHRGKRSIDRLQGTWPNLTSCTPYKGGYGFHPLVCFESFTREAMSGILRPGSAGANHAWDHVEVLCLALEQLPVTVDLRGVLVRCDSAGATHRLTDTICELGMCFSVGFDLTETVRTAILRLPADAWRAALSAEGAEGAELSELDLSRWPAGTRAICRRERPRPGAQLSFTDHDGHRFGVFITNQTGGRIARLEQIHRQRAAIEDSIRCAQDSGLRNVPFRDFAANAAWLELVLMGQDLTLWTQRLLLSDTPARRWEPKRLRYRLLHVADKIT